MFLNVKFLKNHQKTVGEGDPKSDSSSLDTHQLLPEKRDESQASEKMQLQSSTCIEVKLQTNGSF